MTGTKLEKAGWRQGSIIKPEDIANILPRANTTHDKIEYNNNLILVVASQSCDIASDSTDLEPIIELSVARQISEQNGNYVHNHSPRLLHTSILIRSDDINTSSYTQYIECRAFEKLFVPKECFDGMQPDASRILQEKFLESYVAWLAARYSRPALPTEFNNRISIVDPKDQRKKKVKKMNEHLSGIYIDISPNREIGCDEQYRVDLLGLVPATFNLRGDLAKSVETLLGEYAEIMKQAGMDVQHVLSKEDEISVTEMRRFQRFYYDDLSFKEETFLPVEVSTRALI